jgi:hypothetical protein
MRNFEDDDFPDLEGFFDENSPEIPGAGDVVEIMHLELAEASLNHEIMKTVISALQKDFFWKFRSPASKLRMIEVGFRRIDKLISNRD